MAKFFDTLISHGFSGVDHRDKPKETQLYGGGKMGRGRGREWGKAGATHNFGLARMEPEQKLALPSRSAPLPNAFRRRWIWVGKGAAWAAYAEGNPTGAMLSSRCQRIT